MFRLLTAAALAALFATAAPAADDAAKAKVKPPDLKIVSIYVVKAGLSADEVTNSSGVCGKSAKTDCFVWKSQIDYAHPSS